MKTLLSPEPNPTYLSDEEPESSYGIPVLVTNFPDEGRKARGPEDIMPWGESVGQWLADLLGAGFGERWLDAALQHNPQAKLFLANFPVEYFTGDV